MSVDSSADLNLNVEPDNPLIEGDTEFRVRLIYKVNANNPEHARTRFISVLNEFGLNTWVYRVDNLETEEEFLVQEGNVMMPEEYAEAVAAAEAEADAEEADEAAREAAQESVEAVEPDDARL